MDLLFIVTRRGEGLFFDNVAEKKSGGTMVLRGFCGRKQKD
jgi:hypothetical protein